VSLSLIKELLFDEQPWRPEAACIDADPSLFVLEQGQSAAKAKAFCRRCPVMDECYAYGMRTGSVGVWGGQVLTFKRTRVIDPITMVADGRPVPAQGVQERLPAVVGGPVRDARPKLADRRRAG